MTMKKIGIFYGSSTGTCEDLANRIADKLGVSAQDVHSAGKLTEAMVKEYEVAAIPSPIAIHSAMPLACSTRTCRVRVALSSATG